MELGAKFRDGSARMGILGMGDVGLSRVVRL